ncbi:MAG TPA: diacylglycerol kinase family protein [Anaerolineae bacterium]|nr:diacylglycerol kinase family protein [Anaerolineae bacterium]
MRAVIIHNPSSGTHDHRSGLAEALDALRERGWELTTRETNNGGDATRFARQAAEKGFDAAFGVGGDGTLNEVLNGLLDSNTALGVLPFGTANVWALEMGLPLNDLRRAAIIQVESPIRIIDVGMVRGKNFGPRAFILSCGAGFDASVIREVEAQRERKRAWGKLYFVGVGVRHALDYRGRRISVTVDGRTFNRRVLLALTSNAQLYGAVLRLPPDARIDDGLLDVTLLDGENVLHTAWHFIRLGSGIYQQPDMEHFRGREIELRGATLPVHVDAEPIGSTPIQIQVKPHALRVFVPITAHRGLFITDDSRPLAQPHAVS